MFDKITRRVAAALLIAVIAVVLAVPVHAQVYPTNSPVYTPTPVRASASLTAAGKVVFITQNQGVVLMRLTGTLSSLAATFEATNDTQAAIAADTANWTAISATPVGTPQGVRAASVTATGFYRVNAAGYTAVRLNVGTLTVTGSNKLTVQMTGTSAIAENPATGDPCADPNTVKSSAAINVGAATTTKVVDASSGKKIYVCGFQSTLAGTTPTLTLVYGTHTSADCDTGAVSLSGAMAPVTGSVLTYGNGHTALMSTAASTQLCGTTSGTGSSWQGVMTYVQQ